MRHWWLGLVIVAAACADEIPEDVSARMEAARAANEVADTTAGPDLDALLVNAPPGGYLDWIGDIRAGLDSVAPRAGIDRGEALYGLQEVYSRRYDPLRDFYGENGAAAPAPAVARAVEAAGTQLRELMRHLASNAADSAAIAGAVEASRSALLQLENAARAAGMPPTAPRDSIAGTD